MKRILFILAALWFSASAASGTGLNPPALVYPPNSASEQLLITNLKWHYLVDAVSYNIDLSPDSTFATILVNQTVLTDTIYTVSNLSFATKYFWRIKAMNLTDTSDWSSVWSFTTGHRSIQIIPLDSGLNIVSANVVPRYADMNAIIPTLIGKAVYIKNMRGQIYAPPFQTSLSSWNNAEAYMIRVDNPDTLALQGTSIQPEINPIYLNANGWHWLPYYGDNGLSPSTAFKSIAGNYLQIKSSDGKVFQPSVSNSLTSLAAGKGYMVYMTQADTLTYPAKSIIPSITIGSQIWMSSNLDVSTYSNGDTIPQVSDPSDWEDLTSGAWCYYNNDSATGAVYGKLYNWYAVNDSRGLAPSGWHIASDTEWNVLTTYIGGSSIAGGKLKEIGTTHWESPNTDAVNTYGFTALPAGFRDSYGDFDYFGTDTYWWTATSNNTDTAWIWYIFTDDGGIFRDVDVKSAGFSVRCVKD